MSGLSGSQIVTKPAETGLPCIERVGPVRILRGGSGWRGVTLRLDAGSDERFELALTAGDGRCVSVARIHHDEAIAVWRACGQASGLSLLIETPEGRVSEAAPQLGRLALGPVRIRRRYGFMRERRPRFLTRRKTGGPLKAPAMLHAGERPGD